jgi:Tfp pilus assembly protein PilO
VPVWFGSLAYLGIAILGAFVSWLGLKLKASILEANAAQMNAIMSIREDVHGMLEGFRKEIRSEYQTKELAAAQYSELKEKVARIESR